VIFTVRHDSLIAIRQCGCAGSGPGNTLRIAQQAFDRDTLHPERQIHETTVLISDRRPVPWFIP
jgi:hypothetical protein